MRALPILLTAFLFVAPAQAKYGGGLGETNDPHQISTADDLDVLIAAWNKPFSEIDGRTVNGAALICADFDHEAQGKENYRVSTDDLDILIANWNQANAPAADCP